MKKYFEFILVSLAFILFSQMAFSQSEYNGKVLFELESANQTLVLMQEGLSTEHLNIHRLRTRINNLTVLQDTAKTCVSKAESQLEGLDQLIKNTTSEEVGQLLPVDYEYLQGKRTFYLKQLAECRFFIYRSQAVLVDYKSLALKLSARSLMRRGTPVWKVSREDLLSSLRNFDRKTLISDLGFSALSPFKSFLGVMILLLGFSSLFYLYKKMKKHSLPSSPNFSQRTLFVEAFRPFFLALAFFGMFSIFLTVVYSGLDRMPPLQSVSYAFLIVFSLFPLSAYVFLVYPRFASSENMSPELGALFHERFVILVTWVLFGYITAKLMMYQHQTLAFLELARTLYLTILAAFVFWFSSTFFLLPSVKQLSDMFVRSVKISFLIGFVFLLVMEWLGFHALVFFLIKGVLLSFLLFFLTVVFWRAIVLSFLFLEDQKYRLAHYCRQLLGVKPHKEVLEFSLIRFAALSYLLFFSFIIFLKVWGGAAHFVDAIADGFLEGFSVYGLEITPSHILIGLLAFSMLMLLGRFLSTAVSNRYRTNKQEETQIAVSSIILYLSFILAMLFALLIVGVNFKGLAIIAGALSVGAGLGLQNIVNNFVSGLILLLEKPIKPGDRILIGNTEGFVKKIRIRSTQIKTLAKEDVIVPNADLIASQVTNYMFRDPFWRIVCQVGVAYGSDVGLVKELLLEIAAEHPNVEQTPINKPVVLFRSFGDNSLIFELWCVINNVNKKHIVVSEINFAIEREFRKHNVTIAYPQLDIHLKREEDDKGDV